MGNCRYTDDDKILYAYLMIGSDRKIIISAYEFGLLGKYLDFGKNKDEQVVFNLDQVENLPYQIVYGGMFIQDTCSVDEVIKVTCEDMLGCALIDLGEEKVNVSQYKDIVLFPELAQVKNYIPFAALMQTPHNLNGLISSVSLFPMYENYDVVIESLLNRQFLMACREGFLYNGDLTQWKAAIDRDRMYEIYQIADKLID